MMWWGGAIFICRYPLLNYKNNFTKMEDIRMSEPQITNFHGIKIEGFKGVSSRKENEGYEAYGIQPDTIYTIFTDYGVFEISDKQLERINSQPQAGKEPSIFRKGFTTTIQDLELMSVKGTDGKDVYSITNSEVGKIDLNDGGNDQVTVGDGSLVGKILGDMMDRIFLMGKSSVQGTNVDKVIDMRENKDSWLPLDDNGNIEH